VCVCIGVGRLRGDSQLELGLGQRAGVEGVQSGLDGEQGLELGAKVVDGDLVAGLLGHLDVGIDGYLQLRPDGLKG